MKKTNKMGFVIGQLITGMARVASVFGGLTIAQESGLKGIEIHLNLLIAGLILSEAGKIISTFGKDKPLLEYGGVFLQGWAWWVWSLNFPFLDRQFGALYAFHFLAPGLVVGLFCMATYALGCTSRILIGKWLDGCNDPVPSEEELEDSPPR